jgi:delta8-fatty-acid desaturase
MKAFRIGRKAPGIWTNKTPPIRGGIYQKQQSQRATTPPPSAPASPASRADSLFSSPNSSLTSVTSVESLWLDSDDPAATGKKVFAGDAAAYTDWVENQEIDKDTEGYPSLDPAVQQDITEKYRALHQRVRDEGFYNCPYLEYGKEAVRYALLFGVSMLALRHGWYVTSALFLGLFWHQIMFTAHDAAHGAITGIFEVDSLIAMFVADFCCGLSIGWWKSSHNVHHLITNHPVGSVRSVCCSDSD